MIMLQIGMDSVGQITNAWSVHFLLVTEILQNTTGEMNRASI